MGKSKEDKSGFFLKIVKSKWTLLAVGIFFVWGIGYGMGNKSAKTPLSDKKVTYDGLLAEIVKKKNELSSVEDEVKVKLDESNTLDDEKKAVFKEISENQKEFDEAMEILDKKEEILNEIKTSEDQAFLRNEDLEKLKSDIAAKEKELESVNRLIKEKDEKPLELPAGQFIVGKDIPADRYKVTPIGRGSNFQTYDPDGRIDVNIILSNREGHGLNEYVTYLFDGYIIDANTPAKYQPVE